MNSAGIIADDDIEEIYNGDWANFEHIDIKKISRISKKKRARKGFLRKKETANIYAQQEKSTSEKKRRLSSAYVKGSEDEYTEATNPENKTGSTTFKAISSVVVFAVLALMTARYNNKRSGRRRGGNGLPKVLRKKK